MRVIINGGSPSLREDVEPNANDFLKRNWEDGEKGELYRIDDEWWFTDSWNRTHSNATWAWKGTHEPERYHSEWIKRSREREYDYAALTTWMQKVGGNSFTRDEIGRMADIDMMAANAAVRGWCSDWDTLTRDRGKNGYFLRRYSDGKFMLIQWDSDLTFQSNRITNTFIGNLTGVKNFFDKPYVRQRVNYYIGKMIHDYAATGPRMQAWFDCEEAASNSYSSNESTYTGWHNGRVSTAMSNIDGGGYTTNFNVTTGNGSSTTTSADTITLAGTSGWETFDIRVVDHPEAEVSFSSQTAWTLANIQLKQGTNLLTVEAVDAEGNLVSSEVFTVNKTGNALPVLAIDADPGSWNVERAEVLEMDASASYDPEGTALTYNWAVGPASGNMLSGATSPIANATFDTPGIYTFTLTGTDGSLAQNSMVRDASVFAASGWSSFGDPLLPAYWTLDNIDVRGGSPTVASYTLDDRPGKFVLKLEDTQPHPLTMANPSHPAIWRALPESTDWSLQTDVELDTVQQGDFMVGAIAELVESGTTTRYAFGMEDGDFLRVRRAAGSSYTQLASLTWIDDVATIRIRRFGNQLLFEREGEPGQWINVHTRAIPGGATANDGGIFAATDTAVNGSYVYPTAPNASFEFDYVMLIDPNLSNDHLAGLRITEIMYNAANGSEVEYIELTNTGATPIDLAGASFDPGFPFDALALPSYNLQSGESVIITNDIAGFEALFGTGPTIIAEWPGGKLGNGGERIVMRDPDGNVIHDFDYSDASPWPSAADGVGYSLQIDDPDGDYDDPGNWKSSAQIGGTAGVYEFGLAWHSFSKEVSTGDMTMEWVSHPLRTYRVEYSEDLIDWTTLATVPASGTGITGYSDTDGMTHTRRIYRITIVP